MGFKRAIAFLLLSSCLLLAAPNAGSVALAATEPIAAPTVNVATPLGTASSQTADDQKTVLNSFTNLSLASDQAVILRLAQLEPGQFDWRINLTSATAGWGLQLSILQQTTDGLQPTELYGELITAQTSSGTLEQATVGDLLVSLAPKSLTGGTGGLTETNQAVITLDLVAKGALEPNTDFPTAISVAAPDTGSGVYGDQQYITFQVRTNPLYPVYFGTSDQPKAADQSGVVSQSMHLSNNLLNALQAFTVSPNGHLSLVTRVVVRHWVTVAPPELQLSRQPRLELSVPTVQLVDLDRSRLTLDGQQLPLEADLANNRLYATPSAALSCGTHAVEVALYGKASSPAVAGGLLDTLSWQFELPTEREAILTPGKSTCLVNGRTVQLDAAPFIDQTSNFTMVPLRFLGDLVGAQVDWQPTDRSVTFTNGQRTVRLVIGGPVASVNGQAVTLQLAPRIVNGRTMIPLRFVIEHLGAFVSWDGAAKTITVIARLE